MNEITVLQSVYDRSEQANLAALEYDPKVMRDLRCRVKIVQPADPDDEPTRIRSVLQLDTNLETVIEDDPRLAGCIRWNEFDGAVELYGRPITDVDVTEVKLWIEKVYDLRMIKGRVHDVIDCVARRHRYHPVREFLTGLQWDGVPRLEHLLHRYARAEDTDLNRAISRGWMISCIDRALNPGCQVDTTLILCGRQGAKKSSMFRELASSEWFSDSMIDTRNKDAYIALSGVWIFEFAELDALSKRESNNVKMFLTGRTDKYRPPHARRDIRVKRGCVFVGTTNNDEFLVDSTGKRRFWPVRCGDIDLEAVRRDREQLWAEAAQAYNDGEHHWLEEWEARLAEAAEVFALSDAWEVPISEWLKANPSIRHDGERFDLYQVMKEALNLDSAQQHRAHQNRARAILTGLGYVKKQRRELAGGRRRRWERKTITKEEEKE